jgi:hypothetical protein
MAINIIKKPIKIFKSLRGVLILANKNEAKNRRKETKIAPKPKYLTKKLLTAIGIGPVCKKEKIESTVKIKQKIKRIV